MHRPCRKKARTPAEKMVWFYGNWFLVFFQTILELRCERGDVKRGMKKCKIKRQE